MASQGMDRDECSVKTLEAKTQCRLFSERCIEMIAKFQWNSKLPEPPDQYAHDEAVLELSEALVKIIWEKDPAVIAEALTKAINCELSNQPMYLANMLATIGLYLDSDLLRREQLEHSQRTMEISEQSEGNPGPREAVTTDE